MVLLSTKFELNCQWMKTVEEVILKWTTPFSVFKGNTILFKFWFSHNIDILRAAQIMFLLFQVSTYGNKMKTVGVIQKWSLQSHWPKPHIKT